MRKDKLPYGYLLLLAVCNFACLAIPLAVLGLPACIFKQTQLFQVGQCIRFHNPEKELWEDDQAYLIKKILVVGKRKYRTQAWYPGDKDVAGAWIDFITTISFDTEIYYIIVPCPDKPKDTK